MTTSQLWIMLLSLLLLSTALSEPVELNAADDAGPVQVYLPIIANDLPMSSISSPLPTATPVNPPPVN